MSNNKFITNARMEQITSTILTNNNLMPSLDKISKIDIDYLIEFGYDLDIVWDNIDHLSSNDSVVLAAIHPKSKLILMNESRKDIFEKEIGSMNFSKAHELGHWVLHVTGDRNYEELTFHDTDRFYCRSKFNRNPIEIQANMFAASLLMPKILIQEYINELKSYKRVEFKDLYRLKNKLEVSISALVRRIKDLNLLYITDDGKIFESENEALGQLKMY
jgi:Zn-dependent peptidase ImmA (M78 family)